MILLMLDVNDLSWQIISAVTRGSTNQAGRYINKVSDTKFTQYNHMSLFRTLFIPYFAVIS